MATLDAISDALRALTDAQRAAVDTYIVTAEEYTLIRNDALRADIVRLPPPWGGRVYSQPSMLGAGIIVREVGADISDLGPNVIDLRSL